MNRNKNYVKNDSKKHSTQGRSGKGNSRNKGGYDNKGNKYDGDSEKLNAEGRPNDPNYYFLDKSVAEQVSQLAFQQLGGVQFNVSGQNVTYPNILAHFWNPSAGVETYSSGGLAQTGINMAGLRLFTKLSAYTGRQAIYGPQDISTMILALGEVITVMEWIRRVFGVAFLGSESNRSYPRALLNAMRVDDIDFYPRYAQYRNRFNKLVTLVNQIPIPASIAYFDKCAHMYEKVYLDAQSPLATAIVDNPATLWRLNETVYSGGTILETCTFTVDRLTNQVVNLQALSYYLDWAENLIGMLLNSSTLQVVYTDLLNLATKMQSKFWKFDYLADGYMVVPEYNPKYLLMMHNATSIGLPYQYVNYDPNIVDATPLNDVYPDPTNNMLMYNPSFKMWNYSGHWTHVVPDEVIIDMLDPNPTTEDRIEVIRWISMPDYTRGGWTPDGGTTYLEDEMVLSDHYLVMSQFYQAGIAVADWTYSLAPFANYPNFIGLANKVDWCNLMYQSKDDTNLGRVFDGTVYGDLNYYTKIDSRWLRPIFDFTALALYDAR